MTTFPANGPAVKQWNAKKGGSMCQDRHSVKIAFEKGASFETLVSPELHGLFVDMLFEIDDKPVLPDLSPGDYYTDWVYYFFDRCLSMLPDLFEGRPGMYPMYHGLPEWLEYVFMPSDDVIKIHAINEKGIIVSETFEVCLKDFAREVIRSSEEILDYALSVEPDLKRGRSTREFLDKIKNSKDWFYQTYGEKL